MKSKFFSKTLAVLMVLALAVSFAAVVGSAETAATGTSTNFDTYMTVGANKPVPDVTISFNVAAGTPIAGTSSTYEVKAGPSPSSVVVGTAAFSSSDSTTAGTPSNPSDTSSKYATKSVSVDLSGVTFTEPGVYRYVISEDTTSPAAGVGYDSNPRYLDVYVTTDGTDLSVDTYIFSDTAAARNLSDTTIADKSASFENSMNSHNLTFSKAITGNQADKTETFAFTLSITNCADGTYTDSEGNTITVTNGSATQNYTLTDSDTVTVYGLTPAAVCTVSETAGDYTPSIVIDNGSAISAATTGNLTMNADHTAAFTNTRDGVIPTGVILTVAPFAIGLLVAAAVIIFVLAKKRKKTEA